MSELAADGIPVAVTCRVLNIARQPYYRWLGRPVGDAEIVAAHRANALVDAHRDDPEFGYRFLVDEARTAGQAMAERTGWKICSDNGWRSALGKRKKRGKGGKVGPPVHDDLVQRDFTTDGPNRLWLADITEHRTGVRLARPLAVDLCHPWERPAPRLTQPASAADFGTYAPTAPVPPVHRNPPDQDPAAHQDDPTATPPAATTSTSSPAAARPGGQHLPRRSRPIPGRAGPGRYAAVAPRTG
nr:hypothetical protein [Salinispora tropica]